MNTKAVCCAAVFLACLVTGLLTSCGAEAAEPKSSELIVTTAEQTAETEPAVQYLPAPELDMAAVQAHTKIPLWHEDNIPFEIADGGREATIQTYLVDGAESSVVIFPGGGYFQLSEDSEGTDIAGAYNELGYNAFVVCYRYEPYDGQAALADGQRAIQYVRYHAADFGIDPKKIAVCGFSAGGHLSVMTAEHAPAENFAGDVIGTMSSFPDACILAYPVTTLGDGTYETMPRIFLGEKMNDDAAIAEYSYPAHIDMMPPTFVFYSKRDSLVDYKKNSIAFAEAMQAAGKTVVLTEYEDGQHGIGLGKSYKSYSQWVSDSAKFLAEIGF
ncbi:MAG: alpha/beta hydrolase [Clostridia bacterium]|nr:alpha/beta hydrolase [Clostridia bacterium]